MTCGDHKKQRATSPGRTTIMHSIEYTGAAPNPWRVTTDDGVEWDAATDAEAAIELAAYIIGRSEREAQPAEPALPEGAVLI
jgi:hypothetical protein